MEKYYAAGNLAQAQGQTAYENSIGGATLAVEPPLARLYGAAARLRKVSGYADETASRLCGPVPEGKADGEQPAPYGVFNEIDAIVNVINELTASIENNMTRIQNRL